jgi:HAD superfamily hydrolase (TIGR01450 family)
LIQVFKKSGIKAILLDMDGVLYHGTTPVSGAVDFMQQIQQVPHAFITNNPILLPVDIASKMETIGFPRPAENNIITSGEATASWLAEQKPGFSFFAIGAAGLHQSLSKHGYEDIENADFVIVGEGHGLEYESITTAINLILKKQARLVCTNPDITVDATDSNGKHVILPGGGTLVSPIETATGTAAITIGKPSSLLYEIAMKRLQVSAVDCLMIGDRPDTDILGAQYLDMKTALIRTGRFGPNDSYPENQRLPDWDCYSLKQLLDSLEQRP